MRKDRSKEIAQLQEKVFGKGSPVRTYSVSDDDMMNEARNTETSFGKDLKQDLNQSSKDLDELAKTNQKMNERLNDQLAELSKMTGLADTGSEVDLNKLQQEIQHDFGVKVDLDDKGQLTEKRLVNLKSFDGVKEELEKEVIGQPDLVSGLITGFKRPYVIKNKGDRLLNTILVMGPVSTGKSYAQDLLAKILAKKGIIEDATIEVIDLAKYSAIDDEKLFLQDLYSAIAKKGQVIRFINAQYCVPSLLSEVAEFFTSGKLTLKKRYYLNQGQLVESNNALLTSSVDTIEANNHFLVFETRLSKEKLVDLLGAQFISSFEDVITTKPFADKDFKALCDVEFSKLIQKCAEDFSVELSIDSKLKNNVAKNYIAKNGAENILKVTDDLYKDLTQLKLASNEEFTKVIATYDSEIILKVNDKIYKQAVLLHKDDPLDLKEIQEELDEIVGLTKVKEYVLSLKDNLDIQKRREQQGLKTTDVSKHMIFTGNPGTGKTTIARIISKYLRALGVLSSGQLVEVTRADLVGKYVGHTAPLTMKVMKSALGGVLFIDEAYSLYRGKDDLYGLECIDTLVKGIEDYRDDLIVILAGYKKEMEVFLSANTGLKSRFPNIIDFPDYTPEELLLICRSIAKGKDYIILPECDEELLAYFQKTQSDPNVVSGNGRTARNKVEEAILRQSQRVLKDKSANLKELKKEDFRLDTGSFVE